MRRGRDPHQRIMRPHPRRERQAVDIGLKAIAQELGVALVDLLEAADGGTGVDERFGQDGRRSFEQRCGRHFASAADWSSEYNRVSSSSYARNEACCQNCRPRRSDLVASGPALPGCPNKCAPRAETEQMWSEPWARSG